MKTRTTIALLCGAMLVLTNCHGKKNSNNKNSTTKKQMNSGPVQNASVGYKQLQPVETQTVIYSQTDNGSIKGYYAKPKDADGALPGLIVIHEWWGLNDNIRMMTRRLAGLGIQALAVDLYGGKTASTSDDAIKYVREVGSHKEDAINNLKAAFHYLQLHGADKIGVIGWCFGGGWALQTALALPDKIDALVIYYGDLVQDKQKLSTLQMPIIGFFGEKDRNITPEKVGKFEQMLKDLHKNVQVYEYENAGHAFANPSGGSRYKKKAAADAWEKTQAFLKEYLK